MNLHDRLFSALYNTICGLLFLCVLPKLIYYRIFYKKYRGTFKKRLGLSLPYIKKGKRPLFWVHATSLGETKAVTSLIKLLKEKIPQAIIVISNITETGHNEAIRLGLGDAAIYLPFDFSFIVKRVVRKIQPDVVIITEGDYWFHFLQEAKNQGAMIFVVNGKLSERSVRRYPLFPSLSRRLFGMIDQFCVQNELYKQRFLTLDIPDHKICVTGNIKFDADAAFLPGDKMAEVRAQLHIRPDNQVLVIGSTHYPEEMQLLNALNQVLPKLPRLKVLLVPRHPERFSEVAGLLEKSGASFIRWSQIGKSTGKERFILVDAMGILRACYQLANVAIVAGSYTKKVGGHNILEPAAYGVPVLFGPYMHSQIELVDLVNQYQAGLTVSLEKLGKTLITLLTEPEQHKCYAEGGRKMISALRGSTDRTWACLEPKLEHLKFTRNSKK